ncbi:MAG: putative nucleotidyltransferase [Cyclobacteriaceae bacterium]|jgi:predicted nucleotidyltransferase
MLLTISQIEKITECSKLAFANIEAIYIFGSTAEDNYTSISDVDLAVYADEALEILSLWDLKAKIANILNREVDLVDLKAANTVLQMQIISKGKRVYCENPSKMEVFESLIFSMYAQLNEDRAAILETISIDKKIYG